MLWRVCRVSSYKKLGERVHGASEQNVSDPVPIMANTITHRPHRLLFMMTCAATLCAVSSSAWAQQGEDASSEAEAARAAIEQAEAALPPKKLAAPAPDVKAAPEKEDEKKKDREREDAKSVGEDGDDAVALEEQPAVAPSPEVEAKADAPDVLERDISATRKALPSPDDLFAEPEPDQPSEEQVAEDAMRAEIVADAPLEDASKDAPSIPSFKVVQEFFQELEVLDLRERHDFSPHNKTAEWDEVMELVRVEQCRKALPVAKKLVSKPATPQESYTLARIELCAGNKKTANKQLRVLSKRDDVYGDLAKMRLGLSVKKLPAPKSSAGKIASLETRLKSARALARAGKLDDALANLSAMRDEDLSGYDWYKVRLTEAELLERGKRVEDAGQAWLSIYLRTRGWRSGAKIEEMVESFEKRSKTRVLGVGERVDRVRTLVARGRYKEARKASIENAKWAKVKTKEAKGWSDYRKGLEYERKKDREKAIAHFERAEEVIETPEVRLRLYYGWARALRRVDRDADAIALYERICDEFPADPMCAEALYQAGRLLQYQNKHERAVAHFASLVGLFPDSHMVPDALWRGGFSSYLTKDYARAEKTLAHLRDFYGDNKDESELTLELKAQYWIGVAALKRGDKWTAEQALRKALAMGPLTWYGRLAASRLEQLGATPQTALSTKQLEMDDLRDLGGLFLPYDKRLERVEALVQMGFYQDALDRATGLTKAHPKPEGIDRLVASLHLILDRPDLAHWNMKPHISMTGPTLTTLRDWGTAFPLHYMEHSHQWGAKYGVDPFFVQAIIRQESGFRPKVKSYAGAVGLMQLMPGTARYTAKTFLEEEDFSYKRRDLVAPEKNIRLGTMYIRLHTAHASDNLALALAGYNAGAGPLKRWFDQYGERELDAWVESITYQEARGYVRKVMTSYITYTALYGDGRLPVVGLSLPEGLRAWGDVPGARVDQSGEKVSLAPKKLTDGSL